MEVPELGTLRVKVLVILKGFRLTPPQWHFYQHSKFKSLSILPGETKLNPNLIHISLSVILYCHICKQNLEQRPELKATSPKGTLLSAGFKIRFFSSLHSNFSSVPLSIPHFSFLFPCILRPLLQNSFSFTKGMETSPVPEDWTNAMPMVLLHTSGIQGQVLSN